MISVDGVTKEFGEFRALDDVSLEVQDGSLTALLGPSGSGKSTLLRVIAGLELPDAGRIVISGEDATLLPAQRRGIGFVFQHYAAFKHMTVRETVAFGLKIRKVPKDRVRARERHPLALAATELAGVARLVAAEPDDPEQLVDLRGDLGLRAFADAQPEGDVLAHRHVLERRVVLEHEADPAPLGGQQGGVLAGDDDAPRVGQLEAGDHAQ